jgi:hypothetical protein
MAERPTTISNRFETTRTSDPRVEERKGDVEHLLEAPPRRLDQHLAKAVRLDQPRRVVHGHGASGTMSVGRPSGSRSSRSKASRSARSESPTTSRGRG